MTRAALVFVLFTILPAQAAEDVRLKLHGKPKALPEGATTEDWTRYLGAHDDATCRETKLLKAWPASGPKIIWELARGESYAAPTIADGRLFSFDRAVADGGIGAEGNERLECRHPETGKLIWDFKYPVKYRDRFNYASGPRAAPVIDGDLVFIAGVTGQLRALEVKSGKQLWHRDLLEDYGHRLGFFGYGPSPVVWKDLVLVNVGGGGEDGKGVCVAAFDRKSGEEKWRYLDSWGASYSSPVVRTILGRQVLLVLAGGESRPATGGLLVIDPESGKLHFRFPWRADSFESVNASVPIVIGEKYVFLSECYGKGGVLLEFDETLKAKPLWKERMFGMHWMTPIEINGHIYGFAGRNKPDVQFKCLRVSDGKILWSDDMRYEHEVNGRKMTLSFFRGSLLRADGRVFSLGEDGVFAELELAPSGVKTLRRSQLFVAEQSWALPVVHRGLLYIGQHSRGFTNGSRPRLICYDFRAP
jgi:outer membrane protein assembly factor BamB